MKAIIIGLLLAFISTSSAIAGNASYYKQGTVTASGERFNKYADTCAHKSYKFGTILHLFNPKNGKTATCRVNDRGPFIKGRNLDVTLGVARKLGMIGSGIANIIIKRVK